jgi:hypothetical protein
MTPFEPKSHGVVRLADVCSSARERWEAWSLGGPARGGTPRRGEGRCVAVDAVEQERPSKGLVAVRVQDPVRGGVGQHLAIGTGPVNVPAEERPQAHHQPLAVRTVACWRGCTGAPLPAPPVDWAWSEPPHPAISSTRAASASVRLRLTVRGVRSLSRGAKWGRRTAGRPCAGAVSGSASRRGRQACCDHELIRCRASAAC